MYSVKTNDRGTQLMTKKETLTNIEQLKQFYANFNKMLDRVDECAKQELKKAA